MARVTGDFSGLVNVVCNEYATWFLFEDGRLFACGDNVHINLLNADDTLKYFSPTNITASLIRDGDSASVVPLQIGSLNDLSSTMFARANVDGDGELYFSNGAEGSGRILFDYGGVGFIPNFIPEQANGTYMPFVMNGNLWVIDASLGPADYQNEYHNGNSESETWVRCSNTPNTSNIPYVLVDKNDGGLYGTLLADQYSVAYTYDTVIAPATLGDAITTLINADTRDYGDQKTFVLLAGTDLWVGGTQRNGSLGLVEGDDDVDNAPVQIPGEWVSVAHSYGTLAAIKSDGTLWTCGHNFYGLLGIGTVGDGSGLPARYQLQQVGVSTDWVKVWGGRSSFHALKEDGRLYAWGNNGQQPYLGTGTEDEAPFEYHEPGDAANIDQFLYKDLRFPFTTSGRAIQRLMKIELERNRRQRTVQFPAKLTAFRLMPWEGVYLNHERYGFEAVQHRVIGWSLAEDGGVDLSLQADDSDVYSWDRLADEQSIAASQTVTVPDGSISAPVVRVDLPAQTFTFLIARWNPPLGAVSYDAYYRNSGDTDWIFHGRISDDFFGPSTSVATDFHVRSVGSSGQLSDFNDNIAPGPPTGEAFAFSAITWTDGAGTATVQVFYNAGSADLSGAGLVDTVLGGAETYSPSSLGYYWLRSVNSLNNVSEPTSSILVT